MKDLEINVGNIKIQDLIHTIREKQVMLDSDLAKIYKVETKVFNQAVKRNITRFPEEFRFQLSTKEYESLRSQIVTSKERGGRRYLPYAFTEQGIAMLSAILHSDVAIKVSINILNSFVEMRRFMVNNSILFENLAEMNWRQLEYEKRTDARFKQLFEHIYKYKDITQKVFFEGQIYDAFSLMVDLVGSATKSIILIDNYVDIGTLNIFAKKKKDVYVNIYTTKHTTITEKDVANFNKQYPQLRIHHTGVFHDRFLFIDDDSVYHIGASLKDAGKKCFAINRIEDIEIIGSLKQKIK